MLVAPLVPTARSGARRRSRARRLANFKANRRGYISAVLFLALFVISLFAELIANDRPLLVRYEGQLYFPVLVAYPETDVRRRSSRPRPTTPTRPCGADPGEGLDRLAAHSLQLRHRRHTTCPARALAADRPELAGHRRPGPRRPGPDHLRLSHLGPVRPGAHAPELRRRRRGRRRAGLLRRSGRPVDAALHGDLGRHADPLSPDHHVEHRSCRASGRS